MPSEKEVLAEVRGLTRRRLRAWVRQGWIRPSGAGARELRFDEVDVARLRLICELREDLRVNDEAVPIILSLLDQIHGLRRELRALGRAIEAQPREVADLIRARVRESRGGSG